MAYEVHLDVFDGPFDLLLQLIAAQQVDLYEVRLAEIVDGFIAEVARMRSVDLEVATEFLVIAATLVELKLRRLLPGGDGAGIDEELEVFEARDYLLARLVEAKTFSDAAQALLFLEERASRAYARRVGPDERFAELAPDLLAPLSPEDLAWAYRRASAGKAPAPSVPTAHVHDDVVSVAATIEALCARLCRERRTSFAALSAEAPSLAHQVACFLALLELYKRGLVELDQRETFGELAISWRGDDVGAWLEGADEFDLADLRGQP